MSLASPALAGGFFITSATWDFPESSVGKESPYNMGDLGLIPGVGGKIPWRRERPPAPVFWPGEFHGLCSLWGCKESDITERLSLRFHVINHYGKEYEKE